MLDEFTSAPVYECIEKDDVLGFRKLIISGRYTIYDRMVWHTRLDGYRRTTFLKVRPVSHC